MKVRSGNQILGVPEESLNLLSVVLKVLALMYSWSLYYLRLSSVFLMIEWYMISSTHLICKLKLLLFNIFHHPRSRCNMNYTWFCKAQLPCCLGWAQVWCVWKGNLFKLVKIILAKVAFLHLVYHHSIKLYYLSIYPYMILLIHHDISQDGSKVSWDIRKFVHIAVVTIAIKFWWRFHGFILFKFANILWDNLTRPLRWINFNRDNLEQKDCGIIYIRVVVLDKLDCHSLNVTQSKSKNFLWFFPLFLSSCQQLIELLLHGVDSLSVSMIAIINSLCVQFQLLNFIGLIILCIDSVLVL